MDTILWTEESDSYTKRAAEFYGTGNLYDHESEWGSRFEQTISLYLKREPKIICDIGCGYGAVVHELRKLFPGSYFVGIDPGCESIRVAKENIKFDNCRFISGHSHRIDIKEDEVDIVILRMVLQWIPRKTLFQTVAEIDRILKTGGVIWLEDFLPNRPITSVSCHNSHVRIFKEEYSDYFTCAPWYKETHREVWRVSDGEDYQRHISVIMKYGIDDVYLSKTGVTEKQPE